MVEAIAKEIVLQKDYLDDRTLSSIYFGGGTPSLLSKEDLEYLFDTIHQHFSIAANAEITLEANPDDLTLDKLEVLAQSPVNRLSIGVQSFFEEDLQYMNRAHNATEAIQCIQWAQQKGFHNLTIDLIYGSPTTSHEHWQQNIEQVIALNIPHISCYCMTVEPGTALDHFVKKGTAKPVDEEHAAVQFEMLITALTKAGYDHYEISNFALPDQYARHNSNYWLGQQYLGVGPSAHSFNGHSRQWNIANNAKYLKALTQNQVPFEKEILSVGDQYNEYIMTALRTMWGVQEEKLARFGEAITTHFKSKIQPYLHNQSAQLNKGTYQLTTKGKLLADKIAMDAFWVD